MKMLLTIGIPTYNRASALGRTLTTVADQIERAGLQNVEIVVSDNCSIDDTAATCKSVAEKFPNIPIRYSRNEKNIGFDQNVATLFHLATASYVWTLSDDDHISPNAVTEVCKQLKKGDVNFAYINYEVHVDGKAFESRYGAGPTCRVEGKQLLKTIKFSNSLISSSIFNRKAWFKSQPEKYIGTMWIHFFVAREVLLEGMGLIIGDKMIIMMQSGLEKSRAEKRSERSDNIEFYIQAHLKFVQYASEMKHYGYDLETCALAEFLGKTEDIHQIINYKLTSPNYATKQIINTWGRLAKYRSKSLQFWCITTPLLFAPNAAIKWIRAVYRKLKKWH